MGEFLFFLLAVVSVGAVVAMIVSKNPAYSALWLVLAFAATAGLFGLLDAPFIAVVQIIIYAGAIMVLFIFVIMMINVRKEIPPEKKKLTYILSSIMGVVLAIELIVSIKGTTLAHSGTGDIGNPADLGRLLFTKYLYPFEITSILIIAALVGAIV
ncbi:MAG: NADH-quinone oxidoreductase subunit J, partial [Candidatus Aminicenantaceae bacterium]